MKTNRTTTGLKGAESRHKSTPIQTGGVLTRIPTSSILVPVDFSAESRRALEYAGMVGERFRSAVTCLHIVEPRICEADFGYGPVTRTLPDLDKVKKARARLKKLSCRMGSAALPARVLVLSGKAPFEITQAAKALGTDLIIMGCHKENEAVRKLGSTAEQVVRQAPCPVFVLKRKECRKGKNECHEDRMQNIAARV